MILKTDNVKGVPSTNGMVYLDGGDYYLFYLIKAALPVLQEIPW